MKKQSKSKRLEKVLPTGGATLGNLAKKQKKYQVSTDLGRPSINSGSITKKSGVNEKAKKSQKKRINDKQDADSENDQQRYLKMMQKQAMASGMGFGGF